MPKEEKEARKKFKAVTEELGAPPVEMPEETQAPDLIPDAGEKEKALLAVPETNNITQDTPDKHTLGVFVKFFFVTFFATLLALALAGGIYVYLTGTRSIVNRPIVSSPTPVATDEPQASASPSAAPAQDYSTYKVSVLNGNGGI